MKTNLNLKLLSLFLLVGLYSNLSLAEPLIGILKREPIAAKGLCTPKISQNQAVDTLKIFNIKTRNAHDSEILAIGRGLSQIQKLAGGVFEPARNARYIFSNGGGNISRQTQNGIEMSRGAQPRISSVAYFIHELGHYVGNANGAELYRAYKSKIQSRCLFSRYAGRDWTPARARNEEFAEVFAAFVTNPEILLRSGQACAKAFDFFKNEVFEHGTLAKCDRQQIQTAGLLNLGKIQLVSGEGSDASQEETQECFEETTASEDEIQ